MLLATKIATGYSIVSILYWVRAIIEIKPCTIKIFRVNKFSENGAFIVFLNVGMYQSMSIKTTSNSA